MFFLRVHNLEYSNTKPKSQRNSGLFCKLFTSRACMYQYVFKIIMLSYQSIAWVISFNPWRNKFVEVGCLWKMKNIVIYLYSAYDIYSFTLTDTWSSISWLFRFLWNGSFPFRLLQFRLFPFRLLPFHLLPFHSPKPEMFTSPISPTHLKWIDNKTC